jgi:hypothetical protein
MRIIVAGGDAAAYTALRTAGHRILSLVRNLALLKAQIALEEPEGVLIRGLLGSDSDELTAVVQSLTVPTVLLLEPDEVTAALKETTLVLSADTPWAAAAKALSAASPPAAKSPTPSPPPAHASAAPAPPAKQRARREKPRKSSGYVDISESTPLLLYPVVGGAGATTLALSLAAATARLGVSSLAASPDHMTLLARTGIAEQGRAQRIDENLSAMILGGKELPRAYDLQICEVDLGLLSLVDQLPHAAVVIVTRPTGAGRLKAVRTVHTLRRRGAHIAAVVVARQGRLTPSAFERHCRSDDPDFPPVKGLPEDPEVWQTEDVTGHALDTPRYGPAVTDLAQEFFPDLPWPDEDDEDGQRPARAKCPARAKRPQRERRWPIHVELTD